MKHLKKYILRKDVKVAEENQYSIWQTWGDDVYKLWGSVIFDEYSKKVPVGSILSKERFTDIGLKDPRNSSLGIRFVLPVDQEPNLPSRFTNVSENEYKILRTLNGIPEGSLDFFQEKSLPLECNLDYMHGGNFK